MRKHGFYSRQAIGFYAIHVVWIQRYLCPSCGHTVSLLPAFLAPHFQYTLTVIFWILRGLHQLGLPISQVAARWNKRAQAPARIERQAIQYVKRRLRHNESLYRLFLGSDAPCPIGKLLLDNIWRFHGFQGLSESFFLAWHRPFLAKL